MPVRCFVSSLEVALPFYRDVLGFEVKEQWGPAFAILSLAGQDVWLSGPGTSAASVLVGGESPRAGGWSRVVVEVPDLEAFASQVDPLLVLAPMISGPGGKQLLIRDPDGNHLEVFEGL